MLFVEHSLLSHPPASSELDSNENQQAAPGPRPPPEAAGAAEPGEAAPSSSSPEHETSARPEQRPAVEGCVDSAWIILDFYLYLVMYNPWNKEYNNRPRLEG